MQLTQGTTLSGGRYVIKSCIGDGGFGITYVADDSRLDREVVIKEYFPDYMAKRDITISNDVNTFDEGKTEDLHAGISKFLNEAKTLALLNRIPAIAAVYDFFEENNTAYIVMEYIMGKNLKEYIRERENPYSFDEAMTILSPCMYALQKVHEAGIIHRDFAPDNIIIDDRGQVKIIDFGASREFVGDNSTMTVMVKHGYAPAEQYSNAVKQGPYTDVYSLAAILYEMVTLTKPVTSIDRVFEDNLVNPREINPCITEEQERVMLKGLSIIFSSRYQTVDEFASALKSVWERMSSLAVNNEIADVNQNSNVTLGNDNGDSSSADNEDKTEIVDESNKTADISINKVETPTKAPNKKKTSKGLIVVLAIVACATVASLAVLAFVLHKDPATKFVECLEAGDYAKANKIYSEKIVGNLNSENAAYEYLDKYLNDTWDGYINGVVSQEELEKALEKLHKIKGNDAIQSEITEIEEKLQLIQESQAAFDAGKEKQEAGELLEAVEEYNKVSEEDPFNYEAAQEAINEIKESYANNLLTEARNDIASGKYAEAVEILSEASMYFEDDEEIQGLMTQATTLEFEETLKGYIKEDDFAKAKSCYEDAGNNPHCEISDEITKTYNSYVEGVRSSYLTNCRETYKTEGHLAALQIIRDGLKKFPNDATMKGYEELLISAEPVSLRSLSVMEYHSYNESTSHNKDKYDITYDDCMGIQTFNVYDTPNRAFVKFLVDNKYTTLSFKVYNASDIRGSQICTRVITDGIKIYESDYFTSQDRTLDVKVDISGADTLEINANHLKGTNGGYAVIADAIVYNELTDEDFDAVE